jgi:hypothetical protein
MSFDNVISSIQCAYNPFTKRTSICVVHCRCPQNLPTLTPFYEGTLIALPIQNFQSNNVVMSMQMIFFAFFPCSQDVPYVFSWGSQRVPQVPNSTLLLSHIVCPKSNSHVYQHKMWAIGNMVASILQLVTNIDNQKKKEKVPRRGHGTHELN